MIILVCLILVILVQLNKNCNPIKMIKYISSCQLWNCSGKSQIAFTFSSQSMTQMKMNVSENGRTTFMLFKRLGKHYFWPVGGGEKILNMFKEQVFCLKSQKNIDQLWEIFNFTHSMLCCALLVGQKIFSIQIARFAKNSFSSRDVQLL